MLMLVFCKGCGRVAHLSEFKLEWFRVSTGSSRKRPFVNPLLSYSQNISRHDEQGGNHLPECMHPAAAVAPQRKKDGGSLLPPLLSLSQPLDSHKPFHQAP